MSADTVIAVERLGKKYTIGHQSNASGYSTFRDAIAGSMKSIARSTKEMLRGQALVPGDTHEEFWALRDVNFEVKRGEVVGIIGRNGAGKSTLLKILSRITEPSVGLIKIKGRVASLLEVGTGFHPELTGRENVFLNGAILGMTRVEIKRKFDEIVSFAEVEKFLDTPVKRYSSGMYVRLAFAVAAHLEPEILIVDEVLAVGDVEFQRKCLGKMEEVSNHGRTVLFVSHNMGTITKLCERTFWFDIGSLLMEGPSKYVVSQYQSRSLDVSAEWKHADGGTSREQEFIFQRAAAVGQAGVPKAFFDGHEAISIEINYEVRRRLSGCQIGTRVYNSNGVVVFHTSDADESGASALPKEVGQFCTSFVIPEGFLAPGIYYLFLAAHLPFRNVYDVVERAVVFEVSQVGSLTSLDGRLGLVTPLLHWRTSSVDINNFTKVREAN